MKLVIAARTVEPTNVSLSRPATLSRPVPSTTEKPPPAPRRGLSHRAASAARNRSLHRARRKALDVRRLGALGALLDVVLDLVVIAQGLETLSGNRREVDEDVRPAVFLLDEAEALRVVEPLYLALSHLFVLPLSSNMRFPATCRGLPGLRALRMKKRRSLRCSVESPARRFRAFVLLNPFPESGYSVPPSSGFGHPRAVA